MAIAWVVRQQDEARRTSEAPVTVVTQRLQPGGGREMAPRGFRLTYTFHVAGETYRGAAFREWQNVADARPKVCFAPDNPADHQLVAGDETCGPG